MLATALIAMAMATLSHHLGLSEAMSKVISKVLKCPRCLSFWTVLLVLVLHRYNVFFAIGLSLLMAYLAIWSELLLGYLNQLYEKLWQKRK